MTTPSAPVSRCCAGRCATEAGLSASGVVTWYSQLLQFLKNRLLVQDLLAATPRSTTSTIERPIIICGLPRTGTTHLHNLISADPALRSLPYWESLEPVLSPSPSSPSRASPIRDVARTEFGSGGRSNAAMPYFKRMHEMTVDHVHEEIQLLAMDFSTMLFETQALLPSWRDHYKAERPDGPYEYLRTLLKVLQWLRGGSDGCSSRPSTSSSSAARVDLPRCHLRRDPPGPGVGDRLAGHHGRLRVPDVGGTGRSTGNGPLLVGACRGHAPRLRQPPRAPPERAVDRCAASASSCATTWPRSNGSTDWPINPSTDAARGAMESFAASHPRGRHGTIVYQPEVLGIDTDERREALRLLLVPIRCGQRRERMTPGRGSIRAPQRTTNAATRPTGRRTHPQRTAAITTPER